MGLIPSFTVQMDICEVLYLSYIVPDERLLHAIPANMRLVAPSQDKAVISLVMFQSKNVAASFFPFIRFSYYQANIRTYTIDPFTNKNAVFFLKSGITSRFISTITNLLRIPWQSISMSLDTGYDNKDSPGSFTVEGHWEDHFNIALIERREPDISPGPFTTSEEAIRFLTGPSVGFYNSPGGLIRFEVKHSDIKPKMGVISAIHFPILLRSGFITDEELRTPQSVLVAPEGHFTIYMPPTRLHQ